jgi:hypothetical protein
MKDSKLYMHSCQTDIHSTDVTLDSFKRLRKREIPISFMTGCRLSMGFNCTSNLP